MIAFKSILKTFISVFLFRIQINSDQLQKNDANLLHQ